MLDFLLAEVLVVDAAKLEAFRDTLYAGKYNLLLGSGTSLQSRNRAGNLLRGTEQLRADICALTGAGPATSLTRAYGLLSAAQRQTELVDKYSKCTPGPELQSLSRSIWKRIFTFNIDDVMEALYAAGGEQALVSLNFDSTFEPDTELSELQCVHLHGSVKHPQSGFVFSYVEYARALRGNNPWMLLLSEILPSEPFIIAGTSLNEIDLEFYLGRRTPSTPRKGRGPSLLIEPFPDAATLRDCARYDLTLVKAGFGEFLAWVEQTFPGRPSVGRLTIPPIEDLFQRRIPQGDLLPFFHDFEIVSGQSVAKSPQPKPFMYGAGPTWSDINEHLDVERSASQPVMDWATRWLERPDAEERLLLISDDAATGKSTLLKRVGHDLAALGRTVLNVHTLSRIDVDTASHCLSQLASPCIVLVDNLADYADQVRELLAETEFSQVAFIGAERRYRQEFIDLIFSDAPVAVLHPEQPTKGEFEQLVEKYQQSGLLANKGIAEDSQRAAASFKKDTIAVAVCRILNDFRPLDRIIESVWEEANTDQRRVFLACALAHRCHTSGVRFTVLQNVAGLQFSVDSAIGPGNPLPLAVNPADDDFLIPQSSVVGDRVLARAAKRDRDLTLEVFISLAEALAPRVNRKAIILRMPEARLAGRLFDGDKIVRPLLDAEAEAFYVAVKASWEWNSRYWEQRALLIMDRDIQTAVQYARHAIAIEEHPLPMTTLGKVLLKSLDSVAGETEQSHVFADAFQVLNRAIAQEADNARVTIHPFSTLLAGTARYLERGRQLTLEQHDTIARHVADARRRFGGDAMLATAIERLDALL